jgi:crotonobetainyl-CoA:carnitine CoA-transferase CaiB-like acyl-CoA transferase
LGDTGNGFLSAIGVVEALYHRDRTGEGQFVDTSILYAQLLNASMAWLGAGGTTSGRPQLDAQQLGWGPRYRLYRTADDEWICIAAVTDAHAAALAAVTGCTDLTADALEPAFASRAAGEWRKLLDDAGVPCEVSDHDFVRGVFDDPEMIERGWVTSYRHPHVGRMEVAGLLFDLSDTPGRVAGPPLVPGQDTRAILAELGMAPAEVDALIDAGVVDAVDV